MEEKYEEVSQKNTKQKSTCMYITEFFAFKHVHVNIFTVQVHVNIFKLLYMYMYMYFINF